MVDNGLSDDEWGAWGKPEKSAAPAEIESNHTNQDNGFGSDDNNGGGSKFRSDRQENYGNRFQEKRGGFNGNRGGNGNRFNSNRDDDSENKYKRDYGGDQRRNQDDQKWNGNNDRDRPKRDNSRENRREHRDHYQHDDRSNGYKRDDSREKQRNGRNKRDDSGDRGNYRNERSNKRDDSRDKRNNYRNDKNDPFKRDDSSDDNRKNYRKRRDDSGDSRGNYRNNRKEGHGRDDSRERNGYRRNDDRRNDDRRNDDRNDSRERRRRNDSRDNDRDRKRRDDSPGSDYKSRRGRDRSADKNRDMDELNDKFDRNTRLDGNNDGFSSRTFTRGHKTSEHDNQPADDAAVPKRVTFVPNDDQADYELHVNCGINFDNYDKIPVEVTGEDAPLSVSTFAELALPAFLTANIESLKYTKLTPVQKYAIPIIAARRDLMACAQTGSGKTAAFLMPIIRALEEEGDVAGESGEQSQVAFPRALVMAPTRELCRQIFTAARHLSRGSRVRVAYIYGGIEMNKSRRNIQASGCDILVATPGRLIHFLELVWVSLRRMRFLVLDEADRMLDSEGFYESVHKIHSDAVVVGDGGKDRIQISMFSATFPGEIQSLARNLLQRYLFLAVGAVGSASSDVRQEIVQAEQRDKVNAAIEYIKTIPEEKTLVFVESKRMADFFGVKLGYLGFKATTIHGDREQEQREVALNDFKSGRVNLMVATNVAARGLDIPMVDNVVNIDMPNDIETYVHRIGRTGRCGNVGRAISFFDEVRDIGLSTALVAKLEEANQEVPDWLRQLSDGGGAAAATRRTYTSDTRRGVSVAKFVDNPNDGFMKGTNEDYEDTKPSSEWLDE